MRAQMTTGRRGLDVVRFCSLIPTLLGSACATTGDGGWLFRRTPRSALVTPSAAVPDAPTFATARAPGHPVHVVDLAFDVVRIDFPVSPHHHARKVWNHVDFLSVEPETLQRLARNGLRIGTATPDSWSAMVAIFKAAGAKVGRERLMAPRGQSLFIKLGTVEEPETVFRYVGGGQLVGKTLHAGDKVLAVDYVFHPQLGGNTDVRLGFEVRQEQGELTWERRDGIIQQAPAFTRDVFDELAALLTLGPQQFLVIGLGAEVDQEYLVGSRLFARMEAGKRWETLLCIAPKPFQTEGDRPLSLGG